MPVQSPRLCSQSGPFCRSKLGDSLASTLSEAVAESRPPYAVGYVFFVLKSGQLMVPRTIGHATIFRPEIDAINWPFGRKANVQTWVTPCSPVN